MEGTGYAITEIIWWLLVSALIGFVIGWLLRKWFLDRQEDEKLAELEVEQEEQRTALQAELDNWKGKVAGLSNDLDQRSADLDRMKKQVDERDQKIAGFEQKASAHRSEVTKLQQKVEDREATIASLRNDKGKEDSQVPGLRREIDAAIGTIGALRKDTDGYKSTIEALRADLDNERHTQARLEEELAAARSEAAAATSALANTQNSADGLQARIDELESMTSGAGDLEARIASLEAQLATVSSERDTTAASLAELEAEHADGGARLTAAQDAAAGAPAPLPDLPAKDVAVAKVAEIARRTRGDGPMVDDDLKKIHGVGPKLERLLKGMDITSFRQVANFTVDDIQYVTAALDAFPGRIERDDWMSSAADEHLKKYGDPA